MYTIGFHHVQDVFLGIQKMPVITSFTNHSIEMKENKGVYEIRGIIPCLEMSVLASED